MEALEERLESLHDPEWFVAYSWPDGVPGKPPATTPVRPYTTIGVPTHALVQPTYWECVRPQPLYCETYNLPGTAAGATPELVLANGSPRVVPYVRDDRFFWRCDLVRHTVICMAMCLS